MKCDRRSIIYNLFGTCLVEYWKKHPDIEDVLWIQAKSKSQESEPVIFSSDDENSDESDSRGTADGSDSGEDSDESDVESTGDFSNKFNVLSHLE